MNRRILIFSYFLLIVFSEFSYAQNRYFDRTPLKFHYGDSLEWRNPEYSDDHWQTAFEDFVPFQDTVFWVRTEMYLNLNEFDSTKFRLSFDIEGNYEVYWNGIKVGQNFEGSFNNIKHNGVFSKIYRISKKLTISRKNLLAFRVKPSKDDDAVFEWITINTSYNIFRSYILSYIYLVLGIILSGTVLYFIIKKNYISNKLLRIYFVLIILFALSTYIMEFLLFMGIITFKASPAEEFSLNLLTYLLLFSFTAFFVDFYDVKFKIWYLITGILSLLACYFLTDEKMIYVTIGLTPSILIIGTRIKQKKLHTTYSLIFILFILTLVFSRLGIYIWDLGDVIFFFFISVVYFKRLEEKKEIFSRTKLKSVVLETEMLKKILQPHFIMNSLNAVLELLEEYPKRGLRFIKELSDEFRLFIELSDKKSITIKEELELCKKHLKIMEYRQLKKYNLRTNITSLNRMIPPAIFHTLIENGITHMGSKSDEVNFYIHESQNKGEITFCVAVDYNNSSSGLTPDELPDLIKQSNSHFNLPSGTGIKYITSRLEESYGNSWELSFYNRESLWVTFIQIFNGYKE